MDLPSSPTVFEAFETRLSELDREAGGRIQSMYQRMEGQAWDKKGPALVAVRGPRDGELVRAEVTFALREPAGNAAALGMEEGELPGGTTAVFVHRGPRSGLSAGDEVLDAWIGEQGLKTRGDLRWYILLNRPDEVGQEALLTAVLQPIE